MAIAFVGATSGPGYSTTNTLSVSCPAGTTLLVVYIRSDAGVLSGVTFNGVAFSLATSVVASGGAYWAFYLPAPPIGTFNLVVSAGGNALGFAVALYSGTRTDSTVLRNVTSNGSGAAITLANDVGNSWGILGAADRTGVDPTAGVNSVRRTSPGGGASMALFDTNGPQASGSLNMSATVGSGAAALGLVIAPGSGAPSVTVDWLVVGGGGGGGQGAVNPYGGGGGGGGGVLAGSFIASVTSFPVTIGAGGARAASNTAAASPGAATNVAGLANANGGGYGTSGGGGGAGGVGASGGGAGENNNFPTAGGAPNQGPGTGGANTGAGGGGNPGSGGGGGGAGGVGAKGVAGGGTPSAGGAGITSSITGAATQYGAGGTGGAFGGANGGPGASGAANTGWGGGGSSGQTAAGTLNGGDGGSGIVVFSYPTNSMFATGGIVYQNAGNTKHVFQSNGTFAILSIGGLEAQASLRIGAQANLAMGSASFGSQPGLQVATTADLTPGYRPPAFLLPSGYETLEDQAGASVPGGLVWSYAAGTTTPLPTYTDASLTVLNSNPIVCDAAGRWAAWVPIGTAYKLVFETPAIPPAHGSVIRTVDGLQILTLPTWVANPYNVANFTAVGGGTWTVEAGDLAANQFMLDGKRLFISLHLSSTSITGVVSALKIALPPGIVSAGWQQVSPLVLIDNVTPVMGYANVPANSAVINVTRLDSAAFAPSTNTTTFWFNGVIAIT